MMLDPLVACGSLTNRMNHCRFAVRVSLATVQLPAAAVVNDGSDDGGRISLPPTVACIKRVAFNN